MMNPKLISQLEQVRQRRGINLYDMLLVRRSAYDMGFDQLANFILSEGKEGYWELLNELERPRHESYQS